MKEKIIALLSGNRSSVYSGERLSKKLNVSRVTIWKHIKKLQELGYTIASTTKGYQLLDTPDALFSWEFPGRASNIHFFDEVDSTMIMAKKLARKNCPDFTVIIADKQTMGRGRLNRKWYADQGGLYFTMVLRPDIPPGLMSRISFAASLNLAKVLQNSFKIDAKVKWPNDILVNEKKLSGMLCEMEVEDDMVGFLNIGIGINVNNDPAEYEPNAISIKSILGREVGRKDFLEEYLDTFENYLKKGINNQIIPEWKKYTVTIGRRVKIVTSKEVSTGKAVDVDDTGALLLEQEDKSIKKVFYGDCFHQSE